MFEIIKQPKQFDQTHWRYQILHWYYEVEPVELVENGRYAGVPHFFYTKYCPLFHITNILLITCPLIMLWRVCRSVGGVITNAIEAWQSYRTIRRLEKFRNLPPEQKRDFWLGETRRQMTQHFVRHKKVKGKYSLEDFDDYMRFNKYDLSYRNELTEDDLRMCFAELVQKMFRVTDQVETSKVELERRNQAVFWINFSSAFFKIGINIAYWVAAAAFLAGMCYYVLPAIVGIVVWIWMALSEVALWDIFVFLCKLTGATIVMFIGFHVLVSHKGFRYILKPFVIALEAIKSCGRYIEIKGEKTREFFSMFYENNCPPIVYGSNPTETQE